jgi:hypothetical protein
MAETNLVEKPRCSSEEKKNACFKSFLGLLHGMSNISPHLSQLAQKAGLKKGIYQAGVASAAAQMGHNQPWFSHQPMLII